MLKNIRISLFCLGWVVPVWASGNDPQASPAASSPEATISSDQLELIDNGSKTVFTGHVLLEQAPYVLKADRMTRYQSNGLVEGEGHVHGTWINPAGGKTEARGEHA